MRLRPHGTDSGALSRSRNRQVNPLDAPPHPQKSFYLTPISTPMRYQAIILAFRCPLTSICRGAPGQSHWNQSELVTKEDCLCFALGSTHKNGAHLGFIPESESQIHTGWGRHNLFLLLLLPPNSKAKSGQVQHPITFSPARPKQLPMGGDQFSESGELC